MVEMSAKKVLVVDDDEGIRDLVQIALTEWGYSVLTAANGAAALEVLAHSQPDVILLDMRMPVMDGWTFAEEYQRSKLPRVPIIVLTAARDAGGRAQQINADGALGKPFHVSDLVETVRDYLG